MFKAILTGEITKTPEIKKVDGCVICNFTLKAYACKENSKVRCTIWNYNPKDKLEKNMTLLIDGNAFIKNNATGKDGKNREVLNVMVNKYEKI